MKQDNDRIRLFDVYLEDEYQAAIKDSDKYFRKLKAEQRWKNEQKRERRRKRDRWLIFIVSVIVIPSTGVGCFKLTEYVLQILGLTGG